MGPTESMLLARGARRTRPAQEMRLGSRPSGRMSGQDVHIAI